MNEYSLLLDRSLSNWVVDHKRYKVEARLDKDASALLGMTSGEAIIKVLDMNDTANLKWISGVFWYNSHKLGKEGKIIQQRSLISINKMHDEKFWGWLDDELVEMAKKWKVEKVGFGLTGGFYSDLDSAVLMQGSRMRVNDIFYLPKGKVSDEWTVRCPPTKFMLFLDTDEKHSDQQLIKMCDLLDSPLVVAETQRGEHLVCPFLFDGKEYGTEIN